MLEQADVAGHERGRKKAEDLPEREVPRHHGENDAERIPADVCVRVCWVDGLRFEQSDGIGREVAAGSGTLLNLKARSGEGLAHLGGHNGGELFAVVIEQQREATHPEGAIFEAFGRIGCSSSGGEHELGFERLRGERVVAAQQRSGSGIDRLDGHEGVQCSRGSGSE